MEPSHFEPFGWKIRLTGHQSKDLADDGLARAAFIHEYIHYVQFLVGSLGRIQFVEFVRNIILAGVVKHYGNDAPEKIEQINLMETLSEAVPGDFVDTDAQSNFKENYYELMGALDTTLMPIEATTEKFIYEPFRIHGLDNFEIKDFPHIVVHHRQKTYKIPLSDGIFLENMARQIQRYYLFFRLHDTSSVDNLRGELEEQKYICLCQLIREHSQDKLDSMMWTIVLCQISLICERPCYAFVKMYEKLVTQGTWDIDEFLRSLVWDEEIKSRYNKPPMQEVLKELIEKLGTTMKVHENYELREIAKYMCNAHNDICSNPKYFANSLIDWDCVISWVSRFGCPPVVCDDMTVTTIGGIELKKPWHDYLIRGRDLLMSLK